MALAAVSPCALRTSSATTVSCGSAASMSQISSTSLAGPFGLRAPSCSGSVCRASSWRRVFEAVA
eukprot:8731277-Alexandrium_andersonii.AAC.1